MQRDGKVVLVETTAVADNQRATANQLVARFDVNGNLDKPSTNPASSTVPYLGVTTNTPGVFEFDLSGIQSMLGGDDPSTNTIAERLINDATTKLQLSYKSANLNFPTTVSLKQRAVVGNILYFVGGSAGGQSLWRTDGTVVGTYQVKGSSNSLFALSVNDELVASGNTVYYSSGNKVWKLASGSAPAEISGNSILSAISQIKVSRR